MSQRLVRIAGATVAGLLLGGGFACADFTDGGSGSSLASDSQSGFDASYDSEQDAGPADAAPQSPVVNVNRSQPIRQRHTTQAPRTIYITRPGGSTVNNKYVCVVQQNVNQNTVYGSAAGARPVQRSPQGGVHGDPNTSGGDGGSGTGGSGGSVYGCGIAGSGGTGVGGGGGDTDKPIYCVVDRHSHGLHCFESHPKPEHHWFPWQDRKDESDKRTDKTTDSETGPIAEKKIDNKTEKIQISEPTVPVPPTPPSVDGGNGGNGSGGNATDKNTHSATEGNGSGTNGNEKITQGGTGSNGSSGNASNKNTNSRRTGNSGSGDDATAKTTHSGTEGNGSASNGGTATAVPSTVIVPAS